MSAAFRRTALGLAVVAVLTTGVARAEDDPQPVHWPEVQDSGGSGASDPQPVTWPAPEKS
jgi:hypothetical protein